MADEHARLSTLWQDFPAMRPLLRGVPLLQDCVAAYLDFGTNQGTRIEQLYRPRNPRYSQRQGVFATDWFRNVTRDKICVLGFEPNPLHWPRLRELQNQHTAAGRKLVIFPAAISANNSVARFWSDNQHVRKYTGSSLLRVHKAMREANSWPVPTVSLDWLLREHVSPATPMAKAASADGIVSATSRMRVRAKMDIEGAEFDALPPAIEAMCSAVDSLQIEVHAGYLKNAEKRYSLPDGRGWNDKRARLSSLLRGVTCRRRRSRVTNKERATLCAGAHGAAPCRTDVSNLWSGDPGH